MALLDDGSMGNFLSQLLTQTGEMRPGFMTPSQPRPAYDNIFTAPMMPGTGQGPSYEDIQRQAYERAGIGNQPSQPRSSLINGLGAFADAFAELGGETGGFQPRLDAAYERRRQAEGDQMARDEFGLKRQKYGLDLENARFEQLQEQNEAIGRASPIVRRVLANAGPEGVRRLWGDLRGRIGLSPEQAQQLDQLAAENPERLADVMEAFAEGKDGSAKRSLTAVYGKDANGNTIIYQLREDGGLELAEGIRPGDRITPGIQVVDYGTHKDIVENKGGATVSSAPVSGSPATGDTAIPDPGAPGGVRYVQPPGSQAAMEADEKRRKAAAEEQATKDKAAHERQQGQIVLGAVADARELARNNWMATGLPGQLTSMIGGTAGRDLGAKVKTIKSSLGFAQLQAMRDASPTGGALGNVSNVETELLQSTIANLDQAQTEEQFLQALDTIGRETTRIVHGPSVKYVASEAEYKALPPGAKYVSPDGKLREKAH